MSRSPIQTQTENFIEKNNKINFEDHENSPKSYIDINSEQKESEKKNSEQKDYNKARRSESEKKTSPVIKKNSSTKTV